MFRVYKWACGNNNPLSAMCIYIYMRNFPLIKCGTHIYMRITFSNFKQPLHYLRTILNPPYIIIWLINKYLPSLSYHVTSMKDCEQTDSTEKTFEAQLSRKWTLVLTYLLGIASYNLHCSRSRIISFGACIQLCRLQMPILSNNKNV